MKVYIYVWEEAGIGIFKGYVYSERKAKKIEDVLEDKADWFEKIVVEGWNPSVRGAKNLEIRHGEVVYRRDLEV